MNSCFRVLVGLLIVHVRTTSQSIQYIRWMQSWDWMWVLISDFCVFVGRVYKFPTWVRAAYARHPAVIKFAVKV